MTYCPECGSEVEPENTFCAYCGMALTPFVPVVEEAPRTVEEISSSSDIDAPEVNRQEANSQASDVGTGDNDKLEELPPTLTIFDNPGSEVGWSAPKTETVSDNASIGQGSDNNPSQSESFGLPAIEFEIPKPIEKNSSTPDSEFPKAPAIINDYEERNSPSNIPASDFDFNKSEVDEQSSSKVAFDEASLSEKSDFQIDDKGEPQNNIPYKESEIPDSFDDSDFQSTIPYTPRDFASQNLIHDKNEGIEDSVSDKSEALENSSSVEDSFDKIEPIAMPDIPIGSSAHDSLEPKLVSVQIYNPDEQPKAEDSSEINESIYDSQTLLKHSVPKQAESSAPKPARSQTSPNMGGSDTDGRSKAKLKPLDEGTILNSRYEIVRKIGGGGMGAVYLASDRNLGGVLRAVKEMVQSYIEDAQQEKAVNDFKRESLLLTSLEHPAIPTIYDYFYDEKEARFYLVMKYISGGDLAGRLRSIPEGKIDEATVTEWGIQIADVLNYLHNRQPPIVYRDLKPSNIMIDGNTGRVMLIDFGIARWVNKEEKGVTAVGTMGYAPPELFSGNVEPRSDIYSLGSTMFHLLTGADPQSNPLLIFDFHKNPRPRQINSALSDQVEQILMRMVEYSADKRYSNAGELRDALAKHLENLKKGSVTFGAGEVAAPQPGGGLVFCGFCGQKIVATDVFCPFCGAQQPLAGQAKAASAFVAPKLTARIMVMSTNDLDAPMFNLEKDNNLVGRRDPMSNIFPEVDLSKFDPQTKISRRHARIWRESDKFMVEDLGSSNGTVLISQTNEMLRLTKNQPHILTHGDKIRVGDTTLHFMVS